MAPSLGFQLDVVSSHLPSAQANAGHARRMAMELAAERAGPEGVLLTTDADSVVPPNWMLRNIVALHQGADLVCGRAVIDPIEAAINPAHLHADDELERRLSTLRSYCPHKPTVSYPASSPTRSCGSADPYPERLESRCGLVAVLARPTAVCMLVKGRHCFLYSSGDPVRLCSSAVSLIMASSSR